MKPKSLDNSAIREAIRMHKDAIKRLELELQIARCERRARDARQAERQGRQAGSREERRG